MDIMNMSFKEIENKFNEFFNKSYTCKERADAYIVKSEMVTALQKNYKDLKIHSDGCRYNSFYIEIPYGFDFNKLKDFVQVSIILNFKLKTKKTDKLESATKIRNKYFIKQAINPVNFNINELGVSIALSTFSWDDKLKNTKCHPSNWDNEPDNLKIVCDGNCDIFRIQFVNYDNNLNYNQVYKTKEFENISEIKNIINNYLDSKEELCFYKICYPWIAPIYHKGNIYNKILKIVDADLAEKIKNSSIITTKIQMFSHKELANFILNNNYLITKGE